MNFANFSVEESWGNGFVGYVTFENFTAKPIKGGWEIEFEAAFDITNIWDAQIVKKVGDRYTVRNVSWNSELSAGEAARFGFVASLSNGTIDQANNRPTNFNLNTLPATDPGPTPPVTDSPAIPDVDAPLPPVGAAFNYGEALQKSFLFYEAQRAGALPDDNRIDWRGDSTLKDGADVGIDLSGGYFDAGDTVKFGMPMAASMTLLAWGANEYREGYERSGQLDEAMDAIKWGTDYLLKAHVTKGDKTEAFYGQVGLGDVDHAYFGRVEDMQVERPAFKIDAQNPGTDLAAEASAALASAAILFRRSNPGYANKLLTNAKQLYTFADRYRDRYSNSITDAAKFYKSWDGYEDELAWAETWLYKATGQKKYLTKAEANYDGVGWTQSWGDKNFGTSILLAQARPNRKKYQRDAEQWLDNWADGAGGVQYTPGGFAWMSEWGSARMAATASFLAGVYSDTVQDPQGKYAEFAESQIDYLLGDNPNQFSYMVGFGDKYAKQPHHRNATGTPDFNTPANNRHILFGALVGGPTAPNDNAYRDVRSDYVANEVALDYNAGFTGALARMYDKFGGEALSDAQLTMLPGISAAESSL
ncbi:MAG: glycoside hydrolase family 9 protein [Cyanobacteria bacterium J06634_5]